MNVLPGIRNIGSSLEEPSSEVPTVDGLLFQTESVPLVCPRDFLAGPAVPLAEVPLGAPQRFLG